MTAFVPRWIRADARSLVLHLVVGGEEWVEVKRSAGAAGDTWGVDARLAGGHYKLADAFATRESAQGSALLLAMRLLPARREVLYAQLDAVTGAWWWKIVPPDDLAAERRAVFSGRVKDTPEAAERSGRAAGAGWWLFVYGPGSIRALGLQPR